VVRSRLASFYFSIRTFRLKNPPSGRLGFLAAAPSPVLGPSSAAPLWPIPHPVPNLVFSAILIFRYAACVSRFFAAPRLIPPTPHPHLRWIPCSANLIPCQQEVTIFHIQREFRRQTQSFLLLFPSLALMNSSPSTLHIPTPRLSGLILNSACPHRAVDPPSARVSCFLSPRTENAFVSSY
jgi:hypothetical protein